MSHPDDLKGLINEYQRRLQKRKEQEARLGINTPPEILTEIEDIEANIERLQTESETSRQDKENDEITQESEVRASHYPKVGYSKFIGGDNINVSIGNEASNLVVGKNIQRVDIKTDKILYEEDRKIVQKKFINLRRSLANISNLEVKSLILAEDRIDTLEGILTSQDISSNSLLVKESCNWLLDNVSEISTELTCLFTIPTIRKIMGEVGGDFTAWYENRFFD